MPRYTEDQKKYEGGKRMFQNLADENQEDYIEEQNEEIENKKKINFRG